jgi:hypothetical protein
MGRAVKAAKLRWITWGCNLFDLSLAGCLVLFSLSLENFAD